MKYITVVYFICIFAPAFLHKHPDRHRRTSHRPAIPTTTTPSIKHPCDRTCVANKTLTCSYTFEMDNYYTMSKACFDCPLNLTDCYRPTCISGNGVQRILYTANLQLPGPLIAVCEGDTIEVTVRNRLGGPVTSIHWHGIFQKETPYMDGVPSVTQCPIIPYQTFKYRFPVDQSGTYFWHSHSAYQILDGLAGMLIVRQDPKLDPSSALYNYDLDEHTALISDWNNATGFVLDGFHYQVLNNLSFTPPMTVNGRGQLQYYRAADGSNVYTPLSQFTVTSGNRYRFRMVNTVNGECPIVMTIDGHNMTVIATDGNPVKPYTVDAIVTGQGERVDFILNANYTTGNFWMRFQGFGRFDICGMSYTAANIKYTGAPAIDLRKLYTPKSLSAPLTKNLLYEVTPLQSLTPMEPGITGTPNAQFYFTVGTIPNNNPLFYNPKYYPWSSYNESFQLPLNAINEISMDYPSSPLLTQYNDVPQQLFCNRTSLGGVNCLTQYCTCIHRVIVPLHAVTEFILINTKGDSGYHSFHLHGYAFRVVGQATLPPGMNTIEGFKKLDRQGKIKRNFNGPVLKDSIPVIYGGYVIFRFVADNPGFWLFHCHMTFHFETGMGMVIQVGEFEDFVKPPPNFPTCGDFD